MRRFLILYLTLFASFPGISQYFTTGQDPASIRWFQIKSGKFRLIYPESFGNKAQYLANVLEITARTDTVTLSSRVPRIPVILHTHSVSSNGVTVWAPRRIELYTTPPQQCYPEEWLEQLAIHEYRHAVQISKMNQGFTRALYYLFGEQITGGILGLYIPTWFLEGDATVTETALTRTGRGRSALFESTLRAQILEKGRYSFDKATLGSYKTFVPDAYSLGYYLVGQARQHYGPDLWNLALDKAARYPFMVVPFNSGIHRKTGMWKTGLYKQSLAELDTLWRSQLAETAILPSRTISRSDKRNYWSYDHPMLLNDSTLVAVRSGPDDVDRFVMIDRKTGCEKKLLTPGYYLEGQTSFGGGLMVWSEQRNNVRWSNESYAEIWLHDFTKGKTTRTTRKTRYFSPAVSPDGAQTAVVRISHENECSIVILETHSGTPLKEFTIPGYQLAKTPSWAGKSGTILFTLQAPQGETIASIDTSTGAIRQWMIPGDYELVRPRWHEGSYFTFSADYSGIRNVYAMDTLSGQIFRITSGKFASFDPVFDAKSGTMIFSDYGSDGLKIAEIPTVREQWLPLEKVTDTRYRLAERLAAQEKANVQDSVLMKNIYRMHKLDRFDLAKDSIDGKIYPTKKYVKLLHLFNPHSWAPVSADLENLTFNPGVMVLSQNVLSSLYASAGWSYDLSEETGKFYAGLSFQGWYPTLSVAFSTGNRAATGRDKGSKKTFRFLWRETTLQGGVSIPWNLSRGKYARSLTPSVSAELTDVKHLSSTPENFISGWFTSFLYGIRATQYLRSSPKDVYPPFGQRLEVNYQHAPFSSGKYYLFSTALSLYFPGILRHQGILVYGGFQRRNDGGWYPYSFPNRVAYPRGYSGVYDDEVLSIRTNYKFPLWYPDFSAGSVIYLKRLKLNLYYDWANGYNTGYINEYQSAGAELTADFHLLRFVAPFEMGVRAIYYPATGGWGAEFLYSISF